jgi:hypothetical protein
VPSPRALATALIACACLPAGARAAQTVRLRAGFSPDRLGASTTVSFAFTIAGPAGQTPSPLTNLDLRLPTGIGIATTNLGLATCDPAELILGGPEGCPANARVGYGSASAAVPYGPEVITENVAISAFMGGRQDEHFTVLFFAEGFSPVFAQLVIPGSLLEDAAGVHIDAVLPIVPSVPEGPNVALTHLQSTIGPRHITYYGHSHGRLIAFHPRGVRVPVSCPRGGFRFVGDFAFEDGSHTRTSATVPCPASSRSARTPGGRGR